MAQRGGRKLSVQRAQLNWLCRWEALCRHSAARRSKQAPRPRECLRGKWNFLQRANFIAIIRSCKFRDFDEIFKNSAFLEPIIRENRWNEITGSPSLYLFESSRSFNNSIRPLSAHEAVSRRKKNLSPSLESCLRRIGNWNSADHRDEAAHQVPAGKSSFLFRRVTYPTLSNTYDSQSREDLSRKTSRGFESVWETSLGGSMSEKGGIRSKKGRGILYILFWQDIRSAILLPSLSSFQLLFFFFYFYLLSPSFDYFLPSFGTPCSRQRGGKEKDRKGK